MSATLTGGAQMERRLRAIRSAPEQMLSRIGIRGVANAKRLVPRRTGNLGRTIRLGTVSRDSVEVRAGGSLNVGYAAAVERGTRPHVIVPRRARVLAWGGDRTLAGGLRSGSRPTHFARRVNHPGTRARPYLVPGLTQAARDEGISQIIVKWNGAA